MSKRSNQINKQTEVERPLRDLYPSTEVVVNGVTKNPTNGNLFRYRRFKTD